MGWYPLDAPDRVLFTSCFTRMDDPTGYQDSELPRSSWTAAAASGVPSPAGT
jgi:hypothetical protein